MLRNPHQPSDEMEPRAPKGRRRGVAAVGILGMLGLSASACVSPSAPSVGIKPISSDIVFGLKPKEGPLTLPGAPAVIVSPTGQKTIDPTGFITTDLFPTTPATYGRSNPISVTPPPACRKATVNDFAPEAAPFNSAKPPTAGVYKWKYDLVAGAGTKAVTDRQGFVSRTISNVTTPAPGTVEFNELAVLADGSKTDTRYRVRTNAVNRIVSPSVGVSADPAQLVGREVETVTEIPLGDGNGIYPTVPGAAAGPVNSVNNALTNATISVGDPDRGVSILGFTTTTAQGVVTQSVSFTTPFLVLPLPVTPGFQWQINAIDSKTLSTITGTGTASKQAETDACGSVVAGWRTRLNLTSTSGTEQISDVRILNIATQFGGLTTLERFGDENAIQYLEYSLAGVEPTPG